MAGIQIGSGAVRIRRISASEAALYWPSVTALSTQRGTQARGSRSFNLEIEL